MNLDFEVSDLFEVNVIVSELHGKPCVELRTRSTDLAIIKTVIHAAYRRKPLIILPKFNNTLQSIASCVEKGILYKDEKTGQYRFTF